MKKYLLLNILFLFTSTSYAQTSDSTNHILDILEPQDFFTESFSITDNITSGQPQIFSLLQTKVSGLSIRNNSTASGSINAAIRGRRSIYNDHSPLIVLDGNIIDNTEWNNLIGGTDQSNRLIDINIADIANVKVLKGAIGAAKYGIRGNNGVIELTTKSASSSDLKIGVNSAITFSQVNKLPQLQTTYSQGRNGEYSGPRGNTSLSWGALISDLEFDGDNDYPYDKNGMLIPKNPLGESQFTGYDATSFFTNSISNDLNISLQQKVGIMSYYIGAGANTINNPIPTSGLSRKNITTNIGFDLSEKLTFNVNTRYINTSADRTQKGSNLSGIMLGLLRTPASFDNSNGFTPDEAQVNPEAYEFANGDIRSFYYAYNNPYNSINRLSHEQSVGRFIGNVNLSYQLNTRLQASVNTGIDTYNDQRIGLNRRTNRGAGTTGDIYKNTTSSTSYNTNVLLSYETVSSQKLTITSLLGGEHFYKKRDDSFKSSDFNIPPERPFTNQFDNIPRFGPSPYALNSYGAFLLNKINYGNYLNGEIMVRYDLHSTLGKNEKGLLSFAANAELDLLNISNKTPSSSLNKLMLVAAVSKSGNSTSPLFNRISYQPTMVQGDPFISNEELEGSLIQGDIAINKDLSAEKTMSVEGGLKTMLFNNRLQASITYYSEQTDDVIYLEEIDPTSGFDFRYNNGPSISNTGIEVDIQGNVLKFSKVDWTLGVSFSKNNNNVKGDLSNDREYITTGLSNTYAVVMDGSPYGIIVGSDFQKDDDGNLIIGSDGFPLRAIGRQVIGNTNPDWEMGIYNELTLFNNLKISALVDIRSGGDMWCGTCGVQDYFGRSQQSVDERGVTMVFDGVTENGIRNTIEVPLVSDLTTENYRVRYGFGGINSQSIYDTSWIRLRSLQLSYNFNDLVHNIPFIDNIIFSVYANNLLLITDYPGIDPETNLTGNSVGSGLDYYNNPASRTFGASLSLQF